MVIKWQEETELLQIRYNLSLTQLVIKVKRIIVHLDKVLILTIWNMYMIKTASVINRLRLNLKNLFGMMLQLINILQFLLK